MFNCRSVSHLWASNPGWLRCKGPLKRCPRPVGHLATYLPCNEDVLAEGLHGVHMAVVEGRVHHILMKKYVEMVPAFKTAAASGGENL